MKRLPSWVLWALPVAYMLAIFVASSANWGVSIPSAFPLRDKGVHFIEYAILAFFCAHAARGTWPNRSLLRTAAFGALIAVLFGLSDELHQAFVPGRTAELLDLVADGLGAVAGAGARVLLDPIRPFAPESAG
ncbi:MAG: VanZ family protein [Myxococcota bacterium]